MEEDLDFLRRQWLKTGERAEKTGRVFYEGFYSETQMSAWEQMRLAGQLPNASAFGGYEGAERRMVRFGYADEGEPWPIACVLVEPKSLRFAEEWSHRDVLGALMSLGIERDVLGDLRLRDKRCYVFCREEMAQHVQSLESVRRTSVTCRLLSDPGDLPRPEKRLDRLTVISPRVDAVVAELAGLSRAKAAELVQRQRVFVAGQICLDPSRKLKENEVFSIHGVGKFRFCGERGTSKKGKVYLEIERWL